MNWECLGTSWVYGESRDKKRIQYEYMAYMMKVKTEIHSSLKHIKWYENKYMNLSRVIMIICSISSNSWYVGFQRYVCVSSLEFLEFIV